MNVVRLFSLLLGLVTWFGLVGRFELVDLALGAVVVGTGARITARVSDTWSDMPPRRIPGALFFFAAYLALRVLPSMVIHSLRSIRIGARRHPVLRGAIVAVDLPDASDEALLLLAMGTALSPDRQVLRIDRASRTVYVHAVTPPDPESVRTRMLGDYERYVRRATP